MVRACILRILVIARCAAAGVCKVPCFTPLKAYYAPGGGVVFNSKVGYGDRPLELPCGQCRGCRLERSRQWALRCVHEAQMHTRNSFVTLTYDRENLPPDGGLHVEDWQKFAKRLRKAIGPFRFFHCGEYGDDNNRPHYHALLFGIDFLEDRVYLKGTGERSLFMSPTLSKTWGMGLCSIGSVTYESAAYVARYVMKRATGEKAETEYMRVNADGEVWNVRAPYVTMSRRPGIGSKWFDKFRSDVYPEDEVVYDGKRFRPPRFYDSRLAVDASGEALLEEMKFKRRRLAAKHSEDLTPERLRVREVCADARLSSLRRSL